MIDSELLEILRCPETHQTLTLVQPVMLQVLNEAIGRRALKNRAGRIVEEALEGGLQRQDGKIAYPIRQKLPILLIDEGIVLS